MSSPNYGYPVPPAPYTTNAGQKSGGCWKWALGIGLTLVVLIVVFVGGILWLVERSLGDSQACTMAMEKARADARVTDVLGTPIERGWFVGGKINVSTGVGHAQLTIPVHGPRAKGQLLVIADERLGPWKITSLYFRPEGGERITLVGGPEGADRTPVQ